MAKYRGPVCKMCRREGEKLFLKGARCFTPKCSFDRRSYPPGQHGRTAQFRRRRESDFARSCEQSKKLVVFMACWNDNSAAIMMRH